MDRLRPWPSERAKTARRRSRPAPPALASERQGTFAWSWSAWASDAHPRHIQPPGPSRSGRPGAVWPGGARSTSIPPGTLLPGRSRQQLGAAQAARSVGRASGPPANGPHDAHGYHRCPEALVTRPGLAGVLTARIRRSEPSRGQGCSCSTEPLPLYPPATFDSVPAPSDTCESGRGRRCRPQRPGPRATDQAHAKRGVPCLV